MKIRFAVGPHPGTLARDELTAFADAVEAAGFDGIWLSDLPVTGHPDPLLGLALLAGTTSRLRLGANVIPFGRSPFRLAKELAQLDRISDGRLLLAFVPGLGERGEREALGIVDADRGVVLEEVLGLVRRWWSGEAIDDGDGGDPCTGLQLALRPVQDPLEVWLGGRGPIALERAGRVADGWLGALVTPAEAQKARESIEASAARATRTIDPEHFGLSIAYARKPPTAELLRSVARRRTDVDPLALVPVGEQGLREFVEECMAGGLSKFVLRPAAAVESWAGEARWLSRAVLDLQI